MRLLPGGGRPRRGPRVEHPVPRLLPPLPLGLDLLQEDLAHAGALTHLLELLLGPVQLRVRQRLRLRLLVFLVAALHGGGLAGGPAGDGGGGFGPVPPPPPRGGVGVGRGREVVPLYGVRPPRVAVL